MMTIEDLLKYLDTTNIDAYVLDGIDVSLDDLKSMYSYVYFKKFKIQATFKILDAYDIRYTYIGTPDILPDTSEVIIPNDAIIIKLCLHIITLKGGD